MFLLFFNHTHDIVSDYFIPPLAPQSFLFSYDLSLRNSLEMLNCQKVWRFTHFHWSQAAWWAVSGRTREQSLAIPPPYFCTPQGRIGIPVPLYANKGNAFLHTDVLLPSIFPPGMLPAVIGSRLLAWFLISVSRVPPTEGKALPLFPTDIASFPPKKTALYLRLSKSVDMVQGTAAKALGIRELLPPCLSIQ